MSATPALARVPLDIALQHSGEFDSASLRL